jgi:hypothetical protein
MALGLQLVAEWVQSRSNLDHDAVTTFTDLDSKVFLINNYKNVKRTGFLKARIQDELNSPKLYQFDR